MWVMVKEAHVVARAVQLWPLGNWAGRAPVPQGRPSRINRDRRSARPCLSSPTPWLAEFPIPTADSGLSWITTGPDGALWFTEIFSNKVGRITAAGVITEFPIPGPSRGLESITTGSDGALWFTEIDTNQIGRITTDGVITHFNIPTAISAPQVITAGPDGALWFTEQIANQIGRITTDGVLNPDTAGVGNVPTTWSIVGTGDFNGDGKWDILWRDTSGNVAIWEMNGTTVLNPDTADGKCAYHLVYCRHRRLQRGWQLGHTLARHQR